MRKAGWFLFFAGTGCALLASAMMHAAWRQRTDAASLRERQALVERLSLTDLCLATDARYTRSPATTDWLAAFQDHPLALEHFPSGSLLVPPPRAAAPRTPSEKEEKP